MEISELHTLLSISLWTTIIHNAAHSDNNYENHSLNLNEKCLEIIVSDHSLGYPKSDGKVTNEAISFLKNFFKAGLPFPFNCIKLLKPKSLSTLSYCVWKLVGKQAPERFIIKFWCNKNIYSTCFLFNFAEYLEQCWSHAVTAECVLPESNSSKMLVIVHKHLSGN